MRIPDLPPEERFELGDQQLVLSRRSLLKKALGGIAAATAASIASVTESLPLPARFERRREPSLSTGDPFPSMDAPLEEIFRRLPTLEHLASFLQGWCTYEYPQGTWEFIRTYRSLEGTRSGPCNKREEQTALYAHLYGGIPYLVTLQPNDVKEERSSTNAVMREQWYEDVKPDPGFLLAFRKMREEEEVRVRAELVSRQAAGEKSPEKTYTDDHPPPRDLLWHDLTVCRTGNEEFTVFNDRSIHVTPDLRRYLRRMHPDHHLFSLLGMGGLYPWSPKKDYWIAKFASHLHANLSPGDLEIAPLPRKEDGREEGFVV
jgi:hypothetical protein